MSFWNRMLDEINDFIDEKIKQAIDIETSAFHADNKEQLAEARGKIAAYEDVQKFIN